jgi:hypothetical protein
MSKSINHSARIWAYHLSISEAPGIRKLLKPNTLSLSPHIFSAGPLALLSLSSFGLAPFQYPSTTHSHCREPIPSFKRLNTFDLNPTSRSSLFSPPSTPPGVLLGHLNSKYGHPKNNLFGPHKLFNCLQLPPVAHPAVPSGLWNQFPIWSSIATFPLQRSGHLYSACSNSLTLSLWILLLYFSHCNPPLFPFLHKRSLQISQNNAYFCKLWNPRILAAFVQPSKSKLLTRSLVF